MPPTTDTAAPAAQPSAPQGQQNQLLHIPLSDIRLNPVGLRDAQKNEVEFTELVDSIKKYGVINAIVVRSAPGGDGKKYELVDGLQRFSASQEAGKPTIPAQVVTLEEADRIIAQVIGNAVRLDTKPVEYAKALMKILGYNPTWTEAELASRISKSPTWVSKQLGLLKLSDAAKVLVDDGKIVAANAYALAKLPPEEQDKWIDRAQTTDANQFTQQVYERAKQIREANRQGKDAGEEKFVATFHLRKKPEIEASIQNPEVARAMIADMKIGKNKAEQEAALAGFVLALQWVGSTDPKTVQAREQKWKDQKEKNKQDKIRRDAEKAQKKQQEATERASKAVEAAKAAGVAPAPAAPAATK
jgi:ParB family chromosome partitioning protein